ncbi:MAG: flagellar basal body rod protein FlgB [Desulfobulbaceae bacterium]|uniref:Flagellar basal body rod protein FlgB n=1 Tax=Candidatus Desulfobia pelagia TaxID=2841692 RepID=A0A8J6N9Y4_9BACT|nr:flagellar basal body rod protein FlgB [Candidatus Desulfobia pelagia]
MPINKLFSGSLPLLEQALNVRMEKQGLIQSNIANLETPGYSVQDFSFEDVMKSVRNNAGQVARTHTKHMALDPVEVGRARDFSSENRPPDLDEEMMKLSENQLMYEVTTRLMTKKLEGLKYAIDEGGK